MIRRASAAVIGILLLWSGGESCAQIGSEEEYAVKAAFIYNFAKFVEWPAGSFPDEQTPVSLCILGNDPFGVAIDALQGKRIKGRTLAIKRIAEPGDLRGGLRGCHMAFISASQKSRLAAIFKTARMQHVLTIGDSDGFAAAGGVINLVLEGGKVRFLINADAAKLSGLIISSRLLSLGRIVDTRHRGEY